MQSACRRFSRSRFGNPLCQGRIEGRPDRNRYRESCPVPVNHVCHKKCGNMVRLSRHHLILKLLQASRTIHAQETSDPVSLAVFQPEGRLRPGQLLCTAEKSSVELDQLLDLTLQAMAASEDTIQSEMA